ncbi:hypothetical protein Tco_0734740 [Tanacetum coccineum]
MSDLEHSTITYTSISSDDGSLDVVSPGVIILGYDGLPMMPEDPYAYVEAVIQEPPPLDFVPEPVYPEFMPPEDDVLPAEEQPLPVAVSPTSDSPSDITESDDEEEEDESFRDDDDEEEEDTDEEEEEHLALDDSIPPPAYHVDRLIAISTPPPSPLTSYSSPLPQIPSPPLPVSPPLPISPPPLPASPTHPLGYRAAMIRLRAELPSTPYPLSLPPPIVLPHTRASMTMMRAAAPSTYILAPRSETPPSRTPPLLPISLPTSSPPLLLPSTDCRANVPKVTLPPQKRVDYDFGGTLDAEIRRDLDREIGYEITDVWMDPDEIRKEILPTDVAESLMSGQLNLQHRDKSAHARTTRLIESEARASREAWVQSMDASDTARSEVSVLRTTVLAQQTEIEDLRAADRRRQAQLAEALTLLRTLQTQMAALQSQQTPARDPAHPDVSEEAGSSS